MCHCAQSSRCRPVIQEHAVHPFRRMSTTCSDGMSSTNEGMIGIGGRHGSDSVDGIVRNMHTRCLWCRIVLLLTPPDTNNHQNNPQRRPKHPYSRS